MNQLSTIDYVIIGGYLLVLMGVGVALSRKASASLEDYFLGGKKMPWWALGISGMASHLDVAGTMLIVSFLYMLGPRGLFIEFRGGAVLILAVLLLWTGKWNRRSNCMTGAEWMEYRFGSGVGGQFARVITAVAVMLGQVGMITYMVKGIGLFLSMFLPFSPFECALGLVAVATLYTVSSGFYGVVYTDLFQSGIVLCAVIIISIMAIQHVGGLEQPLEAFAEQITGVKNWSNAGLATHVEMPPGYEPYNMLLMFAGFYLLKNVMLGAGMGQDSKYYGARNERECGTLTFIWTIFITMRWPMMMGIAVLGLFVVHDLFPDQTLLTQAAELVRTSPEFIAAFGDNVPRAMWEEALSKVMHSPQEFPQLTAQLADLLGTDWITSLKLLSYEGTVNPERILPAVVLIKFPVGFRGLLLVALLAASMSTFDTNVNMSAAYFTRDLYQRYWRPTAPNRELMLVTYGFILLVVVLGFMLARATDNINTIWAWLMMGLGSAHLAPGMLKFYWHRFNAGGVICGMLFGLVAALVNLITPYLEAWLTALQSVDPAAAAAPAGGMLATMAQAVVDAEAWIFGLFPDWFPKELQGFVYILVIGSLGSVVGTYLSRPNDPETLRKFYESTRPFGLWGPLKKRLPPDIRREVTREHVNDLVALPFTLGFQITLFLTPMLLIIRNWSAFWPTLGVCIVCLLGMYVFWYRRLPPASAGVIDSLDKVAELARRRA